jgi:hypothetical protein
MPFRQLSSVASSSSTPAVREARPQALLPLLHSFSGFRFFLAFLYASGEEVPLLAWKSCSFFSDRIGGASHEALQQIWSRFLDITAPYPLPLELVSLDRRAAVEEYLLALEAGDMDPPLPPHALTHPSGFGAMLLPVQSDLQVHLAGQHVLFQQSTMWRSYIGGLLAPAQLRRKEESASASAAGASGAGSSSEPESAESRQQRMQCIEEIVAEAATMPEWNPDIS